ncbi:IS110 family transposase [Actinoplanes sp. NPDC049548]|uniref:IS110 family transposase n=1 Tax=Actinoplanes sp. NPDC049548 TaxID=3155152 RepID=UPI003437C836
MSDPGAGRDECAEVVLGVDTHKDAHVGCLLDLRGVLLDTRTFAATRSGYRQLTAWITGTGRVCRRAGVEGSHSYGIGLTRHLHQAGVTVIEVSQPDKAERRRRGKTDQLDAEAAARAVLSGRAQATAKTSDGPVETIRPLHLARQSALKARTQAINQLKAVLLGAEPGLRETLNTSSTTRLIHRCSTLQPAPPSDPDTAVRFTLQLLAQRIITLTAEITTLTRYITTTITTHTPDLLHRRGVGPDTAATLLLTAGDNPHRLTGEAAFAALCGSSPVEASSGKTRRHRLNRGGDRQANRALHTVVISRLRWDQTTRDYLERRLAQGKTRREAIRCLKRYVARELYPLLHQPLDNP